MFDDDIIEELVADINSWSNFYIVSDGESIDLVRDFQNRLDRQNISSFLVYDGAEYKFEQDDCLLAVSSSGEDKFVLEVIKALKSRDVKVYGLCIDLKSGLAQLSDECIFADNDRFRDDCREFLNLIAEKVESQHKEEEFEITPAYYLGPSETTFIVSNSQTLILAEELERNLTSKGFNVTIISKGMEEEFKSKLQTGNSLIAITGTDDFFVLAMVEFAKSNGIFVLGMGQDFKSILAKISDEFRILSQVDELARVIDAMDKGFKQTNVEKALITGPSINKSKGLLKIAILAFIIILIILFVFK